MDWVIGIGAAMSQGGLMGVVGCIVAAMRARREGLDDATMSTRLQKIVRWDMATLGHAMFGLLLVVLGIILKG